MNAPNFRPKGIKSCLFCKRLGKILGSEKYYCGIHPLVEFEAANSAGSQPSGYICNDYEEGRQNADHQRPATTETDA